ncbi:MAG: diacylglycerol kinase family lipid kinase [Bacteroidales bacterium]|jgi:YegS/Rv2252/BmrU family lipid kinase|nr:diacylglycerol kinase family lipid kinase [Bacteroidales bacterium]
MIKWYAIVNPNAGNGKGGRDWKRISRIFERHGISAVIKMTTKKGDAIELSRQAVAEGFRNLISIGGDGTLNEIINGIFTQDYCRPSDITIGMIPVGTGNDWGRMFGIPLVYAGAVSIISEGRKMMHDIGVISYYQGETRHERFFINIAGIGYEAMVVEKTNRQKEKGRSNKVLYLLNLVMSLISFRKTQVEMVIDGIKSSGRIFSINVGNGRYCGGGMRQTPDALPDDGLLDITVIREMGRLEVIRNLKLLYDGTILSHPKIDGYRSNNLTVDSKSLLYAEADGESLGHNPFTFRIIPSAINIIYSTRVN